MEQHVLSPVTMTPIRQRIERAKQFFTGINARVIHLGNRAYYSPADDVSRPVELHFHLTQPSLSG
jgi:antirestriction protein ArdC